MKPLEPPDSFHLQAAQGWCELRSFLQANEELEQISPQFRAHPSVLEVRWQIYAYLKQWEGALDIAKALVIMRPGWANDWIWHASSLAGLGRHAEAVEVLTGAADRFPTHAGIQYDLACVCCLLNRVDEARVWLGKAVELGRAAIKLRALEDHVLETLWRGGD